MKQQMKIFTKIYFLKWLILQ